MMFAVMVQTTLSPTVQLWLWALAFAAVGVVGTWQAKPQTTRMVVGLVVALLLGTAGAYASVIEEPYTYAWCSYLWLMNWFC